MASIKKEDSGTWSFYASTGSGINRKQISPRGFHANREATQAATDSESHLTAAKTHNSGELPSLFTFGNGLTTTN
ncbi:MAG: hypothetical protein LKG24_05975 [Lacticaseibacillus songhuajiangensis]|jgi:hypothetical protein|nr:hypothetical protein [Lacticaseibacillus songhuajiangensis]